jgi:SAM-dependent methyltransferase
MGIKAEFDEYASDYDGLLRDPVRDGFVDNPGFYHRRKWSLILNFLRNQMMDTSKMEWLDVGCGKCELLGYGSAHFSRVVGCDPSREMVRNAGKIEVHLQEAPAVLPFPDHSFDFATAVCVYHHVEELDRVPLTREIQRVLRPNGTFCMIEHNPFNPITRFIVSRSPIDVDAHLLTAHTAGRYSAAAGLRTIRTEYFLYLPEKFYLKAPWFEGLVGKLPLGGQYAMFARK